MKLITMKKPLLLVCFIILSVNTFSQITFEKSYFVDDSGVKTECLIKNMDWKDSPTDFKYKLSENDIPKTVSINTVKEFEIYNISKYIRSTVQIDRSSGNINNLSEDKNPLFKEEQLFLKVLVESKANLYVYEEGNLIRYFYNKENSKIDQLIYKKYKVSNHETGKNNRFRQQLWVDLKCSTIKMNSIEHLTYNKDDLIKFFEKYNNCNNSNVINYDEKGQKDVFNLTLRPRLNNSSLSIQNNTSGYTDTDFGNNLGFGFGIEAEFILPFNKNKWAILAEPTYQNFKATKTTDAEHVSGGKLISEIDYSSIEIPLSVRYYLFLNNNSKLFINASYVIDVNFNSTIKFKRADNSEFGSNDVESGNNVALGVGYKFNDKYSLEMRYQTDREILEDYVFWSSDFKSLSIILGYTLF